MTTNLLHKLDFEFKNTLLLDRALRTISYARENNLPDESHQEAFSTLGDGVIDVIVMEKAIEEGKTRKGEITDEKQRLVNRSSLNQIAQFLELDKFVNWGKGESIKKAWHISDRPLAECLESLIGAIYLDAGLQETKRIFWHIYEKATES